MFSLFVGAINDLPSLCPPSILLHNGARSDNLLLEALPEARSEMISVVAQLPKDWA